MDTALYSTINTESYADDCLTHSANWDQHMSDLRVALSCLRSANIQFWRDKCRFGYDTGEFLSHTISPWGRTPSPSLVKGLTDFKPPSTVKELQRFLGMADFYRDYIPAFTQIAEPLYQLTRKGHAWDWNAHCKSGLGAGDKNEQSDDPSISFAIQQIENGGSVARGRYKNDSRMRISKGLLCRGTRVVIPPMLRERVIRMVHNFGHMGHLKTADELKMRYFWKGMYKDVKEICSRCLVCLKPKHHNKPKETLQPYIVEELAPGVLKKRRSSPYHPKGDGLAEHSIGTVKQVMLCLLADRKLRKTEWPLLLNEVSFTCNSLRNSSTGLSPNEIFYSEKLRNSLDLNIGYSVNEGVTSEEYYEQLRDRRNRLEEIGRENAEEAYRRTKLFYDRGKVDSDIGEDDQVILKDRRRTNVRILEPTSKKEKWVYLSRCKAFRRMTYCSPQMISTDNLAGEYIHPEEEGNEGLSEVEGEEEDNNPTRVGEGIGGEAKPKRQRRKTEFFAEPIPWDVMK
ncbi:hypothetical protein LOD99_2157 [Oopsacas minuta]|uniref:Integrase zinc-binding domain-containing protein n=1 Tax=Oopsacas minuta TaxID=111878 RepID=A0AAV7K245_9METZ|nr:hypothetical protein LOD99_2157 [Oopsacas minuta]